MDYAGRLRRVPSLLLLVYEGASYHECSLVLKLRLGEVKQLPRGHLAALCVMSYPLCPPSEHLDKVRQ